MTNKIEETLNLPSIKEALQKQEDSKVIIDDEDDDQEDEDATSVTPEITKDNIDEITKKHKELRELLNRLPNSNQYDNNVDEIRSEAMETYKTLIDLGMNVEAKHAHHFIESGIQSLRVALDSDNSKMDRKVKLAKLELEKQRLDMHKKKLEHDIKKDALDGDFHQDGEDGALLDRNAIIEKLIQRSKEA